MIQSRHSIVIHRPTHEVFKYLQDHGNRLCWQPNLVSHEKERLARETKITEVRNVHGRRIEIEGEITEFEADQKVQRDVARKLPPHEHRRKGSRLRP